MNIETPDNYAKISVVKFNQNKSPLKDKIVVKSIKLDKDPNDNM